MGASMGEQFLLLRQSPVIWEHFREGGQTLSLAVSGLRSTVRLYLGNGERKDSSKPCPCQAGNKLSCNYSSLIEPTSLVIQ